MSGCGEMKENVISVLFNIMQFIFKNNFYATAKIILIKYNINKSNGLNWIKYSTELLTLGPIYKTSEFI